MTTRGHLNTSSGPTPGYLVHQNPHSVQRLTLPSLEYRAVGNPSESWTSCWDSLIFARWRLNLCETGACFQLPVHGKQPSLPTALRNNFENYKLWEWFQCSADGYNKRMSLRLNSGFHARQNRNLGILSSFLEMIYVFNVLGRKKMNSATLGL